MYVNSDNLYYKDDNAKDNKVAIENSSPVFNTLYTSGNITSSKDSSLVIGNLGSGAYISGSQGNLELSGSGTVSECTTISASSGEFDTGTVYIGGEAINKTLVQNIKRTFSTGSVSPSGRAQTENHLYVSGDISGSGTLYGKQRQITHHNYYDSTASEENFIPVNYIVESTSLTYNNQTVAAYDGRIVKVVVHTDSRFVDAVLKIYTDGSVSGTSPSAAIAQNGSTTFSTFTESSGNANFSAGDLVAISITPDASPGNVFVTVVWEYDIFT